MKNQNFLVSTPDNVFELSKDSNLLDMLEKEGYDVQYQCRSGYCGMCRIKITQGEVEYKNKPLALIDKDEILPCCCTLTQNITIEIISKDQNRNN